MRARWWLAGLLLLALLGCRAPGPQSGAPEAAVAHSTATPRPALAFELPTPDGGALALSDYAGQVVLVNFWASWCPPCNDEMADLEAYYREHQAEGFVIIGINVEESPEVVNAFIERHAVTFPIALDLDGKLLREYRAPGLPTSYFVDREGNLLGYWPGPLTAERLDLHLTALIQGGE